MRDWDAEFDEVIGPLSSDQLATIRRLLKERDYDLGYVNCGKPAAFGTKCNQHSNHEGPCADMAWVNSR